MQHKLTAMNPPTAVITGFMGGANPVVILKQDGKTELVKKGSQVWGFTVKKVTRTKVTVVKEGQEFELQ